MSERKVLNKYYPPDYEPSKIPRVKRKNKLNDIRTMAPFNMRCNTCGHYIANATKFNAKKEKIEDASYVDLHIYRIYIKCPSCMASIILRTNPKERGYEVEHGATENFMVLKITEKRAIEEAEAEEEEEKINPMKYLENRTKASKRQMEASEQIRDLRSIKYKHHTVNIDSIIQEKRLKGAEEARLAVCDGIAKEHEEIRQEAKELLKKKYIQIPEASTSSLAKTMATRKTLTIKSSASSSKLSSSLANLKKKIKVIPKASSSDCDKANNKESK